MPTQFADFLYGEAIFLFSGICTVLSPKVTYMYIKCDDCSVSENTSTASIRTAGMAQPVAGQVKKSRDQFYKTVVLLKSENYERKNGKAYMPTTIEMANIKKPNRRQYKKNVGFSTHMPEDIVGQTLQETFPTFDLKNER